MQIIRRQMIVKIMGILMHTVRFNKSPQYTYRVCTRIRSLAILMRSGLLYFPITRLPTADYSE